MYTFVGVWGPMFLFGLFGLSGLATSETSFYIEHMISNLMYPAHIYAVISLF